MAFLGGSAYAMARDIGEGYILLNATILRRMSSEELKQLKFEVDRLLSSIRGDQPAPDDTISIQTRNRKISRLNSALSMIQNQLTTR